MIIKKVMKKTDTSEINLTKYEHYKYFKSSFDNMAYLFGDPTICIQPPDEKEIQDYCIGADVIDEAFWIVVTECGDHLVMDGYRKRDTYDISDFCISSDSEEFIDILISFINEKRWGVMDIIRIKTIYPKR